MDTVVIDHHDDEQFVKVEDLSLDSDSLFVGSLCGKNVRGESKEEKSGKSRNLETPKIKS